MPNPSHQPGENPDTFMQRVRAALGHASTTAPQDDAPIDAPTDAPTVDDAVARLAGPNDDLLAMFTERAEGVGMLVHRVTQAAAAQKCIDLLRAADARRIGIAAGATGQQLDIDGALRNANIEPADWRAGEGMSAQYALDAGITDVHAALAETGTLIVCSGTHHSRGLSLVPPTHLALVRAADVLPDMIDYWQRLKGLPHTELPSSQVFVTGPSKTADIEGELITGVHGPGIVHIILIEDA